MHAVIEVSGEEVRVIDLGSAAGTVLNGQRIDKNAVLHDGDALNFGPYRLEVGFAKQQVAAAPAPAQVAAPVAVAAAVAAAPMARADGDAGADPDRPQRGRGFRAARGWPRSWRCTARRCSTCSTSAS